MLALGEKGCKIRLNRKKGEKQHVWHTVNQMKVLWRMFRNMNSSDIFDRRVCV